MKLKAGRVYKLWIAGASVAELSRMFAVTTDVVEAALRRHVARLMRAAAVLAIFLVACGTPPAAAEIKQPNVTTVCERAQECGFIGANGFDACVKCVETKADDWNREAHEAYGDDLPPLESIACELLEAEAQRVNLIRCVAERWYGPKLDVTIEP